MAIGTAIVLLAVFLVWSVAIKPALRTAREAPVQLDRLESQLQQMQRLAAESKTLRSAPPVSASLAATALKAATDRLGDKARLTTVGDRATLTLNGVSGEALRAWLGEVRSAARGRAVEAQLSRGAQGFTGTVVVTLGGAS
jgi:general secretion pathway protein M